MQQNRDCWNQGKLIAGGSPRELKLEYARGRDRGADHGSGDTKISQKPGRWGADP